MRMTQAKAFNLIAENLYDVKNRQRTDILQRRNSVVNIYGQVLTGHVDYGQDAIIGFSVSPDLIYYSQFAIKIELEPFYLGQPSSGGGSGSSESVYLNVSKSLSLDDYQLASKGDIDSMFTSDSVGNVPTLDKTVGGSISISPNPHNHGGGGGGGGSSSATTASFDPSSLEIWLDGVDLTPYFIAQYGQNTVHGYGVYPTDGVATYDILEAVNYMSDADYEKALKTGYKRFEVKADGIVEIKIHLYLSYNFVNR